MVSQGSSLGVTYWRKLLADPEKLMRMHCTKCGKDSPIVVTGCACSPTEYMIELSIQETLFPNLFLPNDRIIVWLTRGEELRWVGCDSDNGKVIFQSCLPKFVFPIPMKVIDSPDVPFTS